MPAWKPALGNHFSPAAENPPKHRSLPWWGASAKQQCRPEPTDTLLLISPGTASLQQHTLFKAAQEPLAPDRPHQMNLGHSASQVELGQLVPFRPGEEHSWGPPRAFPSFSSLRVTPGHCLASCCYYWATVRWGVVGQQPAGGRTPFSGDCCLSGAILNTKKRTEDLGEVSTKGLLTKQTTAFYKLLLLR